MIKVIAFDFVGVLVREKNIKLTYSEGLIERLFGPNLSDELFLNEARKFGFNRDIMLLSNNIINKLYEVKDRYLIGKIKDIYPDIKIIAATNHISLVRNYIKKNIPLLDDIIISSEINRLKPHEEFYNYILDKYDLKPNELLFIDDRDKNIEGANQLGIKTIKVDNYTNIFKEIMKRVNNENN